MLTKFAVAVFALAATGMCLSIEARGEDKAPVAVTPPAGIQWFATWDQGLREAKRTNRPILLVAATPHCHEVSGLW